MLNEYEITYLCNGKRTRTVVLATSRAGAAKWARNYERNRGNDYKLIRATRKENKDAEMV